MFARAPSSIARFQKEERGSVAMMFSIMAASLFLFAGLAIDYGRITNVHSSIASAADAATLAAGKALLEGKLSDDEVAEMAKTYFVANSKSTELIGAISAPNVTIDRESGRITVEAQSVVAMTFGRLSGFDTMTVPVVSETIFRQKDIEVGMALDITGSMNNVDFSGKRKIDGLKQAFETFANKLLPDGGFNTNSVRIGLAPYSSGINLGPFAASASANRSQDGCVTESRGAAPSDDTNTFYVRADGARDNRTGGTYICPSSTLEPLSNNKSALVAKVNSFRTWSSTSGHFGVQWAWNLVSDKWAFGSSRADSYDKVRDETLVKAVVLMTDGIFNTAFHGGTSARQALDLCAAMKEQGVIVLTVGFEAPNEPADRATLEACASPGEGNFAIASNANQLEAIFANFAGQLTNLRITR